MTQETAPAISQDENHIIAERRGKLTEMRQSGNAFPNDFRRDSLAGELHHRYNAYRQFVCLGFKQYALGTQNIA